MGLARGWGGGRGAILTPKVFVSDRFSAAAWPLTPPCPLSPTALPPPGERGLEKQFLLLQSPSSPWVGGCEVGEEGRGGEGLGGAEPGPIYEIIGIGHSRYDLPGSRRPSCPPATTPATSSPSPSAGATWTRWATSTTPSTSPTASRPA